MNARNVIILAVVAVAVIVVAALVSRRERIESPVDSAEAGAPMFDGLTSKAAQVAAITIKHGDQEFTVKKDAQGAWSLADKGGYPAKPDEVRKALAQMSELRQGEAMTSKPDRYSQIGVQDLDGKPNTGPAPMLVTLRDDKDQPIASAIVGNQKFETNNQRGVYIRKVGDQQSWLARGELDVPTEPLRWVEAEILKMPKERVKSVTVTQPEGETLVIARSKPEDAAFAVQDLPQGKELKTPSEPDTLATALSYLTMEDVAPMGQIDFKGGNGFKPGAHAEFRTFDGLVIAYDLADKDGKTWAAFVANYEPTGAEPPKTEGDKPAENKTGQKTPDEVKKEVEDLNSKFSRFAYEVPQYKAQIMGRKMADMLKSDQPPPLPASLQGPGSQVIMPPTPGAPAITAPAPKAPASTGPTPAPKPSTSPATGGTGSTGAPAATGTPAGTGG